MITRRLRRFPLLSTLALAAFLGAFLVGTASSAKTIKMPTLSPEGSPWDTILKKMGETWKAGTDGRVELVIYPGGVAGDESDILRKIRVGQYQATAVSVSGLVDIDDAFTVFEVPLFYRSFDEMRYVLDALSPVLKDKLEKRGFITLGWGYVGWVYFFTSDPVASMADMQNLKIWTWAGDETMVAWWRRNGFKPVSLAATDIITGLETGMINAVSVPPLYAMQMQYYKKAKYMADLPLAPMMGAIIIDKRTFDRLSPADQKVVLAAGEEAQTSVMAQIPKLDETAIKLMEGAGMKVLNIKDGANAKEFLAAATKFADNMRGDIVPTEIFDLAFKAREAYRKEHGDAGSADSSNTEKGVANKGGTSGDVP